MRRRTLLALAALPAACARRDDDGPAAFRPIRYDYLTKLRLNVGRVDITEAWQPPGRPPNVDHLAPTPPTQALRMMAEDRLLPGATAGRAVFTIRDAAIRARTEAAGLFSPGSAELDGRFSVRLEVFEEAGRTPAGFAEATVTRNVSAPGVTPRVLDDMVRRMMDDMNVELEFQIRRSLRDWLQPDAPEGVPPAPLPVEQEPLTGRTS
jgi:hypothetical protein